MTLATPDRPSCLLVVDVQHQFINAHTRHVVPGIEALLPKFDWVFASRLLPEPGGAIHRWKGYLPAPASDPKSALAIDLSGRPSARTCIVEKTGFGLLSPSIAEQLRSANIQTAHIVGTDTDLCVMRTAGDLMGLGIRPVVITDLVASTAGEPLHSSALLILKRLVGRAQLTTSAQLAC